MKVVCNASPLIALEQIGQIALLQTFDSVLIAPAVEREVAPLEISRGAFDMKKNFFGVLKGVLSGASCGCFLPFLTLFTIPLLDYGGFTLAAYAREYWIHCIIGGAILGALAMVVNREIDKANPNHPSVQKRKRVDDEPPTPKP